MNSRTRMNGKPVFTVEAKSVINFDSGFKYKLLCDGPTFSLGSACAYSCTFCYVPDMMRKLRTLRAMAHVTGRHEDIVIRRQKALAILHSQLAKPNGQARFDDFTDTRVVYASPLVDVAANIELAHETAAACKIILDLTHWQIRLLSKSDLLPVVAHILYHSWAMQRDGGVADLKRRMIFGVSTGTLDDGIARALEPDAPLVSKRLESLHWLQDNGFRTFGMICPSLPQLDSRYREFARAVAAAIRADRCEHVWAEVMNARGESFDRALTALGAAGYHQELWRLEQVALDREDWELYARNTFEAHTLALPAGKLRFLQYVTANTRPWWEERSNQGAIIL